MITRQSPISQENRLAFISHASEDDDLAEGIGRILGGLNVRTWIDNSELHWKESLELVSSRVCDGLQSATDFVAIASKASSLKPWVLHEWLTASARWLACGSPRIHLVSRGQLQALPDLPYTSLSAEGEQLQNHLTAAFNPSHPRSRYPHSADDWIGIAKELRSQHLMGSSTAVQAIHTFDHIFPSLRSLCDEAVTVNFSEKYSYLLEVLRLLSRLLDLRAEPKWLAKILRTASKTKSLLAYEHNILLNNAGMASAYICDWGAANQFFKSAIFGCLNEADLSGAAMGYGNLALVELERGNFDSAEHYIDEARTPLKSALNNLVSNNDHNLKVEILTTEGNLANHLGRVYVAKENYEEALRCFSEHLALSESLEQRRSIGIALGRLAWVDLVRGDLRPYTEVFLQRYIAISVATLNARGTANAYNWYGQLYLLTGKYENALTHFKEEAKLREYLNDQLGLVQALSWVTGLCRKLSRMQEFETYSVQLRNAAEITSLGLCEKVMTKAALDQAYAKSYSQELDHTRVAGAAFKTLFTDS